MKYLFISVLFVLFGCRGDVSVSESALDKAIVSALNVDAQSANHFHIYRIFDEGLEGAQVLNISSNQSAFTAGEFYILPADGEAYEVTASFRLDFSGAIAYMYIFQQTEGSDSLQDILDQIGLSPANN
jgi:hypothetical protein